MDHCIVCGEESTVGCIGFGNEGVYHNHYCDKHYLAIKIGSAKQETSIDEVHARRLGFRTKSLNEGQQLVLKRRGKTADFWPSTKKFVIRATGESGMGLDNLARVI